DLPAPGHPGCDDRDRSRGGARRADRRPRGAAARRGQVGGAQGLPRAVPGRAVRPRGRAPARHLPLPGAEDPAGLELLRRRIRRRRGDRAADGHRGAGQPCEGRRGQRGPVPQHPHGLARVARPVLPRPAPRLSPGDTVTEDPGTVRPLTVVKCGGNASVDAAAICADVAGLVRDGQSVVLVHGGSGEIARLAGRLGVPQRTVVAPDNVSTRYTDPATLEVVTLALAGGVKPKIVAELARLGVPAVGLTGLDGGMLRARRKSAIRAVVDGRTTLIRDNYS